MACYVSSASNRVYVALESTPGDVAEVGTATRVPIVNLQVQQERITPRRRDKTGSRTFAGAPVDLRRRTEFKLRSYMNSWPGGAVAPAFGPLVRACMWGDETAFAGIGVAASDGVSITTTAAHGLVSGLGVGFGGELRFVAAVPSVDSVILNAPFSISPTMLSPSITYTLGHSPKTVSVFDYWAPSTAVQRIITGAVVDEWRLRINGDFHEFEFRGPATDVVDSASFASGQGNMSSYPAEPLVDPQSTAVVPGHLGQAWLGSSMTRFGTLTGAEIVVKNNVDARDREFGSPGIRCIAGGERQVFVSFSIHERDNEATRALYQAARSASPVSVMFQLGQQPGQMCGLFLRNVVPQVPEFDDSETKLQWKFGDAQAIGVNNDELFVAFS